MLSKETIEKMRTLEAALYAAQDALCDEAERLTEALRSVGRGVAAQVDPEGVAVYPDPQRCACSLCRSDDPMMVPRPSHATMASLPKMVCFSDGEGHD